MYVLYTQCAWTKCLINYLKGENALLQSFNRQKKNRRKKTRTNENKTDFFFDVWYVYLCSVQGTFFVLLSFICLLRSFSAIYLIEFLDLAELTACCNGLCDFVSFNFWHSISLSLSFSVCRFSFVWFTFANEVFRKISSMQMWTCKWNDQIIINGYSHICSILMFRLRCRN